MPSVTSARDARRRWKRARRRESEVGTADGDAEREERESPALCARAPRSHSYTARHAIEARPEPGTMRASGVSRLARIVVDSQDKKTKRTFALVEKLTTIGRMPACTIQIDDKVASRKHCVIKQDGDTYTLRDMGSANVPFSGDSNAVGSPASGTVSGAVSVVPLLALRPVPVSSEVRIFLALSTTGLGTPARRATWMP